MQHICKTFKMYLAGSKVTAACQVQKACREILQNKFI